MEKRTVILRVKNIKTLIRIFGKYQKKIPFIFASFKKAEKQLWIYGHTSSRTFGNLEKIDYDEIFILDDSINDMPDSLDFKFIDLTNVIKTLNIYIEDQREDIQIKLVFRTFLDYGYCLDSFTIEDSFEIDENYLEIRQGFYGSFFPNFDANITKLKDLCKMIMGDLFENYRDKYADVIKNFRFDLVEKDISKIFFDSLDKFIVSNTDTFFDISFPDDKILNGLFNTDDAILKFGLKASIFKKLKSFEKLYPSGNVTFEYDSEKENPEIIISNNYFNFTYKDGYIRNLSSEKKHIFEVDLSLLNKVPSVDYDVFLKDTCLILESRTTNMFYCFGLTLNSDDE